MRASGYCYDNAACESFFATLKNEAFPENKSSIPAAKERRRESNTSKLSTTAVASTPR
jgi:transposase InsO family protein